MRRVTYIAAVLAAASTIAAEPLPADFAQGRDLRAYEVGGVYRAMDSYIPDVQRLRKFVWTHWTQKRRGYVEIVFQGIDAGFHAYLFIEPVNGRWGIVWCDVRYSAVGGPLDFPREYAPTIRGVERCRGSLVFFDEDDNIVKHL